MSKGQPRNEILNMPWIEFIELNEWLSQDNARSSGRPVYKKKTPYQQSMIDRTKTLNKK